MKTLRVLAALACVALIPACACTDGYRPVAFGGVEGGACCGECLTQGKACKCSLRCPCYQKHGANGRDANVYNNQGVEKYKKGDLDGAIVEYTSALAIDPKNANAYYNRGLAKDNKKDYDGAIADYSQALEIDPKHAISYYNRGNAKRIKGDLDGAIADYTSTLKLDPKFADAYNNRGYLKKDKGDLDGAIADFTLAIAINPKHVHAYNGRGNAKKAKGDLDSAIADYTQAIELNSKSGWPYYYRGCLRYETHAWTEALADFRQAVGKAVSLTDYARIRIYLVRARQGDGEAAKAALAEYRKERPAEKAGDWQDKILAFLTGDLGEKEFLEATASNDLGKRCEACFFAGSRVLIEGDKAKAKDLFEKCLETGFKNQTEYTSAAAELDALNTGS